MSPEQEFLSIAELEQETPCKARGCRGRVRLSLVRRNDLSGFVGGLGMKGSCIPTRCWNGQNEVCLVDLSE
ncbi:hypothetical protein [Fodinicurvata halophila]|uniref:hypothetical protein n=1 Tax=Fodinicurvata halophila TaxID=1419723 RepID=UPI003634B711